MILGKASCAILIIFAGYLWPAYQSYKAVSLNDPELNREWCIYWTVFGVVISTSAVTDLTLFWLPLYWEAKLLLVLFLWHPNVKGALYVFDRLVKPFMSQNEAHIDGAIVETQQRIADGVNSQLNRIKSVAHGNASQIFDRMRSFSEQAPSRAASAPPRSSMPPVHIHEE